MPNPVVNDVQEIEFYACSAEYEARVRSFCRNWLAGQQMFTLQTSGSTGAPKTVSLTRHQMIASARLTGGTFGLRAGDPALCCLNVAYVGGLMMLVRALELNLRLTVTEPVANPLARVPDRPFRFQSYVPLQLQTLLETPDFLPRLNAARAILVGGAAVSPGLETDLQRIEAPVFSTYAMTETVSHVATRRLNGPERSERFRLLEGVEAGTDARGCLWVRGAMTNGETVQTNDVVDGLSDRTFRWLGRYDALINSGGVKVQPEGVEAALEPILRERGFTGRFFVVGLPDERLGECVAVCLEGSPQPVAWERAVVEALVPRLGRYELPRAWCYAERFAETPTGKIDKLLTLRNLNSRG
jgi:O-succinylbenzoic acid--CoA ligase